MDLIKTESGVKYSLALDPSNITIDASYTGAAQPDNTLDMTAFSIDLSSNTERIRIDTSNIIVNNSLNITVDGKLNLNGDISHNGDLSLNGNIIHKGDLSLNGNISHKGDLSMNGDISLNGDLIMNGDISNNGDISLNGIISATKFNIPGDGGTTTHLTDNILQFDWGGKIHMTDGTYIKVDSAIHIEGYVSANNPGGFSGWYYLYNNNSGDRWRVESGSENLGLRVDNGIYSPQYYGQSDIRIKTEIETVDDNEALDIVNKLECKKYHYTDPLRRRNMKTIGFIAQEVKENIPNAVVLGNDYIPNILKKSIDFTWQEFGEKWKLKINDYTFENKENYTGMYKLALLDFDSNTEAIETCKLEQDKTFILNKKYKEVFLLGNEINDFHKLDKNMIFSLHHSAIQELDRKIVNIEKKLSISSRQTESPTESLESKIDSLTKQFHEIVAQKDLQIANQERRISALEKQVMKYNR